MIIVFYAGREYETYENWGHLRDSNIDNEIYNGAYCYYPHFTWEKDVHWYRLDRTPILDEDVPDDLKAWIMLMGIS